MVLADKERLEALRVQMPGQLSGWMDRTSDTLELPPEWVAEP
jgi:hypothetical protein